MSVLNSLENLVINDDLNSKISMCLLSSTNQFLIIFLILRIMNYNIYLFAVIVDSNILIVF